MKKSVISLLILPLLAGTLAGCKGIFGGGDEEDSTITKISIMNFGGGVGSKWLYNAIEEFEEINKDRSFEDGRTGVKIEVDSSTAIDTSNLDMKTYNMYFTEAGQSIYNLANSDYLLDLSSLVNENCYGESKTILSKIDADYVQALKGANGKIYALPHYEWYPGITFNKEIFDQSNLYFADDSEDADLKQEYTCKYGTRYFIANKNAKKTCGNDGIYGTDDDGLPTSIEELLILCAKLKSRDVVPFIFAGNHKDYSHYLLQGLLSSLGGRDSARTFYTFNGAQNVVKGLSSNKLWGTDIPDIEFEERTITEANGYLTRETAERYYGLALLKEIYQAGFTDSFTNQGSTTNKDVEEKFICGEYQGNGAKNYGMLIEGNYWYNEAQDKFKLYHELYNQDERVLGWMSLPTLVNGSVTEGHGRQSALMDIGYSYTFINSNVIDVFDRPGLADACKEFYKFIYSDDQLVKFTKETGIIKAAVNYDMTGSLSQLSTFQKQVISIKQTNGAIYGGSNSQVFINNKESLILSCSSNIWKPTVGGVQQNNMFTPLMGNYSPWDVFQATFIGQTKWVSDYLN
ncbi:MAG: hypothetical protein MJ248_01455 [Bacilli bacterium]|nr:hypothetical protein [Bacilli bacterium]